MEIFLIKLKCPDNGNKDVTINAETLDVVRIKLKKNIKIVK
jgi:uncharacterized membrane protein YkoI